MRNQEETLLIGGAGFDLIALVSPGRRDADRPAPSFQAERKIAEVKGGNSRGDGDRHL
jgi:hypothetical protein